MIDEKLNKTELLEFIRTFYDEYELVPNIGFLAGYFKVTKRTISVKLDQLEKDGQIKRIFGTTKRISYDLL